jgi:transcriptional regulator with XRE-family HTH domain
MKLNFPRAWFDQQIEKEGEVSVGAGIAQPSARTPVWQRLQALHPCLAFSQFVNFWRRDRGWTSGKLAAEAGVEAKEIDLIERTSADHPSVETVGKLARVFGVPSLGLFELIGLSQVLSARVQEETAPPESTLSASERETLEACLAALMVEPES